MKRILVPAILALAIAAPALADTRNLTGFTGVAAAGKFDVEVSIGDSFAVEVSGRDAAEVVTRVRGDDLVITQNSGMGSWFGGGDELDATVHVSLPSVDELSASRGAALSANGVVSNALTLRAIQGGALSLSQTRAGGLSATASQGGAISVAGVCRTLRANVSMGGVLDAEELNCTRAEVAASMGGSASVHASDGVDANASMGGVIDVSGHPTQNDTSAMMGGAISIN